MAMIKCAECGKAISDKASSCVGCGAPVIVTQPSNGSHSDANVDGVSVFERLKNSVTGSAEAVAQRGEKLFRSDEQVDAASIEELAREFSALKQDALPETATNCARFKSALESTIDAKFAEVMRGKTGADRFLSYVDGQILTASVRNVFRSALGSIPPQIEAACTLSEAIVAPSGEGRGRLGRTAIGIGGGATGIGIIAYALNDLVGKKGLLASVKNAVISPDPSGSIALIVLGVTVAGIAGYFSTRSNKHADTQRFLTVMKNSSRRAVDAIWPQHEIALIRAMNNESTA